MTKFANVSLLVALIVSPVFGQVEPVHSERVTDSVAVEMATMHTITVGSLSVGSVPTK